MVAAPTRMSLISPGKAFCITSLLPLVFVIECSWEVARMPYREIPVTTKVNAVIDHIRGLRPADIERKHQVDRDSLRWWVRKAKLAMAAALTPNPGRPSARRAETPSAASQLSQKSDVAEPTQALPASRTAWPAPCPLCGGSHLVRNGSYPTGGKRTPLERVQRFVCRDCGGQLYGPKKNSSEACPAPGLPKRRRRRKPPASDDPAGASPS